LNIFAAIDQTSYVEFTLIRHNWIKQIKGYLNYLMLPGISNDYGFVG
jgi:hypothetical protein